MPNTFFNLTSAYQGVVNFITENVTMPNVPAVPVQFRGLTFPRYRAPHVPNQPACEQLDAVLPGNETNQPEFGCAANCINGCVHNLPSIHNPGPSFADENQTVDLIRLHKVSVHFSCVRALLILQQARLDDTNLGLKAQHTYSLARVLMRPSPGDAFRQKTTFINNVVNGNYSSNATGVWKMWQTGTTGLRNMDLGANSAPSPSLLKFRGVTDPDMVAMPRQMACWDVGSGCSGATPP